MISFRPLFVVFLAIASVISVPVAEVNLERRSKIQICGVSFRQDIRSKCGNNAVYVRHGSTVAKESMKSVSKDYECDHVLELQVLKSVAEKSGLCKVIDALHAVDKTQTAAALLNPAKQDVNKASNLFFVSKDVNGRKLATVRNALKDGKSSPPKDNPDLNKAVKSYVSQVGSSGKSTASTIDSDFAKIKSTAQSKLPKTPKTKQEKDLDKALKAYNSKVTVSSSWTSVVNVVNKA